MPRKFFTDDKTVILNNWIKLIIATYPNESGKYLSDNSNKFSNPIGSLLKENCETIFNYLFQNGTENELFTAVENIIKIRIIQDFTPEETISFIPLLRLLVRKELLSTINTFNIDEYLELEEKFDILNGIAINIFTNLKEKIYEIKYGEMKSRFGKMIERLNDKYDQIN